MTTQLPQWYYDLNEPSKATGTSSKFKTSQINKYEKPGFFKVTTSHSASTGPTKKTRAQEDQLKIKKAWEIAYTPAKNLPVNLAMSWFSGSGLQIMTISMTLYMFFINPIREIMDVQNKFRLFEGSRIRREIFFAKVVYIFCCLLSVAAGVWKVKEMGLLPTHSSDWSAFEEPAHYRFRHPAIDYR